MSISIEVEAFAGSNIGETCQQVIDLANKLGITVMCPFNGVKLMACPGDCAKSLQEKWKIELKSGHSCKIARGIPDGPHSGTRGAVV